MITPDLVHYLIAGGIILLGAIGAGLGLGHASAGVEGALTRQPTGHLQNFHAMIIGLALIESGAIVALVSTLIILFNKPAQLTWPLIWAEGGAGIAIGLSAVAICIASSYVVRSASYSISRQPLFGSKIITYMLIAQAIIEAPVIFSFIVALIICTRLESSMDWWTGFRYFACGLTVGLGAIGPSIGQSLFARSSSKAMGINVHLYNKIFTYALLIQALIETPMIFCLLYSLIFLFIKVTPLLAALITIKGFIAALTISFGALGGCIGMGYMSSNTSQYIALEPSIYAAMFRSALITITLIESTVIYALVIALFLIVT